MKAGATPQGVYTATLQWAAEQGISAPVIAAIHGPLSIPREWLVCVRAVNASRYTSLMLRRKDCPSPPTRESAS